MKKALYSVLAIICLSLSLNQISYAQDCVPTIFTYQEADYFSNFTLASTADGGYFFTGSVTTEAGDKDLHIVRVDSFGNLLWSKSFGGAEDDIGKNAKQTADGGFIIVGQAESFSTSDNAQAWIIKTDGNGNEEWSYTYDAIEANDVEILPSGKYIIAGTKIISVGPTSSATGLWMAQIDGLGNIEIEETDFADIPLDGTSAPFSISHGNSVEILESGSYLFVGKADRDTEIFPTPNYTYTIKTNELFEVEWESITEGEPFLPMTTHAGTLHSDGYYYIAGTYGDNVPLSSEAMIQKIDDNGNVIWQRNYGDDPLLRKAVSIRELADGNLIVGGKTTVFKVDTSGLVLWNSSRIGSTIANTGTILDAPEGGLVTLAYNFSFWGLQLSFLDSLGNNCENRVTGRVYRDNDANCEFDPEQDEFLPNSIVYQTPFDLNSSGTQISHTTTNLAGEYILRVDTGAVEVAARLSSLYAEPEMWDLTCPDSTYTLTFSGVNQEQASIDFAFTPLESCPLLRVSSTLNQIRPFVASNLFVSATNVGTEDAFNVSVDVEMPDLLVPNVADIDLPYTQTGNIFTFIIDTVHWGEQTRIKIPFITDEAAMIGDTVCVRTQIFQDTICGEFMGQGSHIRCRPVTNSYDPNEKILDLASGKTCLEENDEELFYTIHFQNTGNDTAYQVVITDSLSNLLDLNTFRLLSSSHDVQYDFGANRALIFTFSNINLLDSLTNAQESQGYVEFSIFPVTDFTLEQIIANRAQIYFDYNEPIVTEYAYAYSCLGGFSPEIINIEYDFSCGDDYGNLSITAFHPEPLLYSIDNGENWQTNSDFLNLLPTDYAICVKSVNDLIIHAADDLTDFNLYSTPEITDVISMNPSSVNNSDGEIMVNATGENIMEYSIDNGTNWQISNVFSNLMIGGYQPVVRYVNGFCAIEGDIVNLTFSSSNQDLGNTLEIFKISPNPFADDFIIENQDENLHDFSFKITDAAGRTVLMKDVQAVKTLIKTANWVKGIYFIYLENENGYSVQRLVKQ